MNAIRDHVNRDVSVNEPPSYCAEITMMQRCHRVHEVRHVMRASIARFVENTSVCSRMSNRDDPTSSDEITPLMVRRSNAKPEASALEFNPSAADGKTL